MPPQLSKEEVSSRFEAAQVAYAKKISTFAYFNHTKIAGFSQEDLQQEMLIVLWHCVAAYDPDKGATFNTLFTGSARNRLVSLIRQATAQRRSAVMTSLEADGVQKAIDELLSTASAEEQALLQMRIKEHMLEKGGAKQSGATPIGTRQRYRSKHRARQIA